MSLHNTLANKSGLRRHRNVLSREERLEKLEADGKWDESKSVLGLPKVRNVKVTTGKAKKAKEAEEGAEGAEGAEGVESIEGVIPASDAP